MLNKHIVNGKNCLDLKLYNLLSVWSRQVIKHFLKQSNLVSSNYVQTVVKFLFSKTNLFYLMNSKTAYCVLSCIIVLVFKVYPKVIVF